MYGTIGYCSTQMSTLSKGKTYAKLRGESIVEWINNHDWSWIWKVLCRARIALFIWLAAQERLPTKDNLVVRKVTFSDNCPHCFHMIENVLHVLRYCPLASNIWVSLSPPPNFLAPHIPFSSWFKTNCFSIASHSSGILWCTLLSYSHSLVGASGRIGIDTIFTNPYLLPPQLNQPLNCSPTKIS